MESSLHLFKALRQQLRDLAQKVMLDTDYTQFLNQELRWEQDSDEKILSLKQLQFKGSSITLPRLVPGKYDIQLILDTNENGEWDPIDPKKNVHPERVLYFPEAVTIRANWDVEKKIELD